MKITRSILLLLIFFSSPAIAQNKDLFEKQLFISGEDTLPCRILTPIPFDASKKYPLLIFLHGAGERGNDNEAQLTWGTDVFLDSLNRIKFPAIVIFPQCPANDKWSEYNKNSLKDSTGYEFSDAAAIRKPLKLVSDFIDTLLQSNQIDKKRVYIGGLSMGGFGTLELLWRKPQTFAAAFPICGATNPNKLKDYRKKCNKPNAKLIVCGITATDFTIADPSDPNMYDIAGGSSELPSLISTLLSL